MQLEHAWNYVRIKRKKTFNRLSRIVKLRRCIVKNNNNNNKVCRILFYTENNNLQIDFFHFSDVSRRNAFDGY